MKYKLNDPQHTLSNRVYVIKEVTKCGQTLYGLYETTNGQNKELHTFYEKRLIDVKMDNYLYQGLEK